MIEPLLADVKKSEDGSEALLDLSSITFSKTIPLVGL
jgi:hypothetical protein